MTLGVPDLLRLTRLNRSVADIKQQADRARTETVTGLVDDLTKESRGDIGGLHLLRKAVDDAQGYQQNLKVSANRAQRTQTVLASLTKESATLATDVLSYIGPQNVDALQASATNAKGALYVVFSNLNTDAGGRALFSGDRPDVSPLADPGELLEDVRQIIAGAADAAAADAALDQYFNDPAGGFATDIYKGGANEAAPVEIAPGVRVAASVRADAQPIKDLIRGLAVIANYETTPQSGAVDRDGLVRAGADILLTAESNIVDLRSVVGVAEGRIQQRIDEFFSEEQALTSLYNSRTTRDPYEAASALQLLQAQLEASYTITARLSQLSLTNFLR
jgi:flagellar hook-associated protein 3 FlgL